MAQRSQPMTHDFPDTVKADGEQPIFAPGDQVRISMRFPIGHFRVPNYIRGKKGNVEAVIERFSEFASGHDRISTQRR